MKKSFLKQMKSKEQQMKQDKKLGLINPLHFDLFCNEQHINTNKLKYVGCEADGYVVINLVNNNKEYIRF